MWTCPDCARTFRSINQGHTCGLSGLLAIFNGRPDVLRQVYDTIETAVKNFGPVSIDPMKSAVLFKAPSVFMVIKIKKDHLSLQFILRRKMEVFPVSRTLYYTKYKVVHFVELDSLSQVNSQLISWLKESYLVNRVNPQIWDG
jgi:hypothetical protein